MDNRPGAQGPVVRGPLGRVVGARSGDKGGDANIGVWARTDAQWRWLEPFLTVERLNELLPETRDHAVRRYVLPNLRAVNFVIEGLLQEGVSASTRFDPQGKALGEWLRSRLVDVPESILVSQNRARRPSIRFRRTARTRRSPLTLKSMLDARSPSTGSAARPCWRS